MARSRSAHSPKGPARTHPGSSRNARIFFECGQCTRTIMRALESSRCVVVVRRRPAWRRQHVAKKQPEQFPPYLRLSASASVLPHIGIHTTLRASRRTREIEQQGHDKLQGALPRAAFAHRGPPQTDQRSPASRFFILVYALSMSTRDTIARLLNLSEKIRASSAKRPSERR